MQNSKNILGACLITVFLVFAAFAQNKVDLTFNAAPLLAVNNTDNNKGQVVQADGKVIVWGGALAEGGLIKGLVARLNIDGSVDTSFNFCGCSLSSVTSVAVEASGEMLVAGSTSANRGKVVRIFSDGSLDIIYATPFNGGLNSPGNSARIRALLPDGKAIIESATFGPSVPANNYLARYETNGLLDYSFTQINLGPGAVVYVPDVAIAPDGKIYIGTSSFLLGHSFANLKRFNDDGTPDGSWNAPAIPQDSGRIGGVDVQADGSILVTGLAIINGVAVNKMARILPAGNVDLTFTAPSFIGINQVKVLSDGKILISANDGVGNLEKIYRLNSNGSIDNSLVRPVPVNEKAAEAAADKKSSVREPEFVQVASTAVLNRFSLDGAGNVVFFGQDSSVQQFYRLSASGTFDSGFDAKLSEFGKVSVMLRQTDGKVLINGTFIGVNGVPQGKFARLNSDGSLDATFNAGTAFDSDPVVMQLLPDGKILAAGGFQHYNGVLVSQLVRLNSDGSLDGGFTPHVLIGINTIAVQPDGKILAAGAGMVRLNVNGTVDNTFSPIFGSNSSIRSIVLQADGKVVVGGSFVGVNGFNRTNFVRLNSDGTLDQTYNPAVVNQGMASLWLQPDGKILACSISNGLILMDRLNLDGTTDTSFSQVRFQPGGVPFTSVDSVVIRPNGEILAGGQFNFVNDRATASFAWLNRAGKAQPLIFPEGVNGAVHSLALQPDGKLLMAGDFSRIDNTPRPGVARVSLATFHGAPQFDFDGDGRADISIFRPSDGNWYIAKSSSGFATTHWGQSGDRVVAADYDGDGKSDLAVYRDGTWWYIKSTTNTIGLTNYGTPSDIPMPSDYDGDGKADFVFFRQSTGEWFRNGSTGVISVVHFGQAGDIPQIADFDGDGKADPCIFRPSDGVIWYDSSIDGLFYAHPWGQPGDIPVLGDYDGDGKTDPAVFRPSDSFWFIMNSNDGSIQKMEWGFSDDRPTPADYDGDGRTDLAIYRPSNGMWFISQSTAGPTGLQFGLPTDKAVPNAFIP